MVRRFAPYVILAVAGFLAVVLYTNSHEARLRDGLVRSCERVNVLRAQSNVSDLAIWRILSGAARRESALAKTEHEGAKTHMRSARVTARYAGDVTITALTDCGRAIDDPAHYKTILAGPIGDPLTGKENPEVASIERASKALARRTRN